MIQNLTDTPAGWMLLSSRSQDDSCSHTVVFEAHLSSLSDLPMSASADTSVRDAEGRDRARAACAGYALRQYLTGDERH